MFSATSGPLHSVEFLRDLRLLLYHAVLAANPVAAGNGALAHRIVALHCCLPLYSQGTEPECTSIWTITWFQILEKINVN